MGHCYVHFAFVFTMYKSVLEFRLGSDIGFRVGSGLGLSYNCDALSGHCCRVTTHQPLVFYDCQTIHAVFTHENCPVNHPRYLYKTRAPMFNQCSRLADNTALIAVQITWFQCCASAATQRSPMQTAVIASLLVTHYNIYISHDATRTRRPLYRHLITGRCWQCSWTILNNSYCF